MLGAQLLLFIPWRYKFVPDCTQTARTYNGKAFKAGRYKFVSVSMNLRYNKNILGINTEPTSSKNVLKHLTKKSLCN